MKSGTTRFEPSSCLAYFLNLNRKAVSVVPCRVKVKRYHYGRASNVAVHISALFLLCLLGGTKWKWRRQREQGTTGKTSRYKVNEIRHMCNLSKSYLR